MKKLFASVRYFLFLLLGALAIASLFRHSIRHALDAHPLLTTVSGANRPVLHFSPDEDLERFDEQQLRQARTTVDISMYSFTDRAIAEVLRELAAHGVAIRLYRDQEQYQHEELFSRHRGISTTDMLRGIRRVQIRVKRGSLRDLMHQKDYCLDGKWLRDGSANWSPGAEKHQDNSVWTTTDSQQVAAYERKFNEMWSRSSNLVVQ